MAQDIAIKLKNIRKSMRLTQSQFAELVNLSEDSVGKIERGISIPTISTLKQVAASLNIPLSELLEDVSAKGKPGNKALDDFIKYLQTKSTEEIKLIHEIAVKILER